MLVKTGLKPCPIHSFRVVFSIEQGFNPVYEVKKTPITFKIIENNRCFF
jgi:hypothetical protein